MTYNLEQVKATMHGGSILSDSAVDLDAGLRKTVGAIIGRELPERRADGTYDPVTATLMGMAIGFLFEHFIENEQTAQAGILAIEAFREHQARGAMRLHDRLVASAQQSRR